MIKYVFHIVYELVSSVQIGQEPKTHVFLPKPFASLQSLVQSLVWIRNLWVKPKQSKVLIKFLTKI